MDPFLPSALILRIPHPRIKIRNILETPRTSTRVFATASHNSALPSPLSWLDPMGDELPRIPSSTLANFASSGRPLPLTSPRSLTIVRRLGYDKKELLPVSPKTLFVKGTDNKETLKIKVDNYEVKRLAKIEACQQEYENCKVRRGLRRRR